MEPRDKLCSFYSHDLDKVSLVDLVTFAEEILNGKLHFLRSENLKGRLLFSKMCRNFQNVFLQRLC